MNDFTELLALRFTWAAAHFLWQGALIGLIVWVIDRLARPSPAIRHSLYVAGLIAMAACLPVNLLISPPAPPVKAASETIQRERQPVFMTDPADGDPLAVSGGPLNKPPITLAKSQTQTLPFSEVWTKTAVWIFWSYACGLLLMLVRLARGMAGIRWLRI